MAATGSVAGLLAATQIRSPAQLAADTGPPQTTVLTAAVELRLISDRLVRRGTVTAAMRFEVTPAAAAGDGQAGGRLVVTALPEPAGAEVVAGESLVEVAGRPLVALTGERPAYRDLRPDDSGKDVEQLQAALAALGLPAGADRAGHFGAGTKAAVVRYYQRLGYDAPTTDGPAGAGVEAAQDAVTQAARRLAELRSAAEPSPQPSLEPSLEPSPRLSPGAQLEYAAEDLAVAQHRLERARAAAGPMVPMNELVFLPVFPVRLVKVTAAVGDEVRAPLLTLVAGGLVVTAALDPADAPLVRAGLAADLAATATGYRGSGTVTTVGPLTVPDAGTGDAPDGGGSGSGGASGSGRSGGSGGSGGAEGGPGGSGGFAGQPSAPYLPITITPAQPLPAELIGHDVQLTVEAAHSDGEVLAVPEAAITASADGTTFVVRLGAAGERTRVAVDIGVSGGGLVAVTPVGGGLAPGDRVVIGS